MPSSFVCLSVCPSVRHTPVGYCLKTAKHTVRSGGATPGPGRSYALPLKKQDLALQGPACDIVMKYKA